MARFEVNVEKCVSCGQCVDDCVFSALRLEDGHPIFSKPDNCIGCLHCFAICPVGAIIMDGHNPDDAPAIEPLPSYEQMQAMLRQRRSIRHWKQENVDRSLIREIMETAWNAPTGVNYRGLHVSYIDDIIVMNEFRKRVYAYVEKAVGQGELDKRLMERVLGHDHEKWLDRDIIFRGAPHMLATFYGSQAHTGLADAMIYLPTFEYVALSRNIGALWLGFLSRILAKAPELLAFLGMPDNYTLGYPMAFGYPAVSYSRGVNRYPANLHVVKG